MVVLPGKDYGRIAIKTTSKPGPGRIDRFR